MATVEKLSAKAQVSRLAQGEAPIVETVADAIALARAVSQRLEGLTGDDRLLMLSNLDEVRRALDGRMARLETDMAEQRQRLTAVNKGLRAVDGYGGRGRR
ncbi:hypothetical protein [Caulobacter segnis]|jgi:hypothetical protein|uniref:hypothetical protein n=1 Tax=Caulobacter segnis TaxID=88688 RepID=UPI001CBDD584|nr:hypothetical protein [Caulobacter segnis]UAL10897.1 hypothetical protein K8940_00970 [Caulobacter segnis]